MRYPFLLPLALASFNGSLHAAQRSPSYQLTDHLVVTMGDKAYGHIGACLVEHRNKPKVCFGLTKPIDGKPRFTFVVVFRTGVTNCKPTGVSGTANANGSVSRYQNNYTLGRFTLPVTLESKRDPKSGKVVSSKIIVGDAKLSGKGPRVVIVDLTGDKPKYRLAKVDLPACNVNLADKSRKTWAKAIDDAIAELKKKSKVVKSHAD